MKELLIGCGVRTKKDLCVNNKREFENPVRLDINEDRKPDVVHDLNVHPLPFDDNEFDEIHAYDVLEHLGSQGDYKFFFKEFTEYARILKPKGLFIASVPLYTSVWAFGDPSHTRVFCKQWLYFLDQDFYTQHVDSTQMSDFRYIYKSDFKLAYCNESEEKEKLYFVLEVRK